MSKISQRKINVELKKIGESFTKDPQTCNISCIHCGEIFHYWGLPEVMEKAACLCGFCYTSESYPEGEPVECMSYRDYLSSLRWKAIKNAALSRAKHRCQICNSDLMLHVHHRKYPEELGSEEPSDLIVLCRRCHDLFHKVK